jgi:phosphohistidine phosphatase SixA
VRVLLVRHGCAGDKRRWDGPDDERPLDEVGGRQAEALAEELAPTGARRLGTSPTRRCRDTLVPLGRMLGLPVADLGELRVDAPVEPLIGLLTAASARDAVFCTHGEVMARLLDVLVAGGVTISAARLDEGWLLAKGSGWELAVDEGTGRIGSMRHVRPAGLEACAVHGGGTGAADAAGPADPAGPASPTGPASPGRPGRPAGAPRSPGGDRR